MFFVYSLLFEAWWLMLAWLPMLSQIEKMPDFSTWLYFNQDDLRLFGDFHMAVSLALLLGVLLWLAWGAFGFWVEYIKKLTEWRAPIRWSAFIPYILLFLATSMFLWFPLNLIWRPLFYIQGGLFVISTVLNVTSHKPSGGSHDRSS